LLLLSLTFFIFVFFDLVGQCMSLSHLCRLVLLLLHLNML
jgi:hypothetical protein